MSEQAAVIGIHEHDPSVRLLLVDILAQEGYETKILGPGGARDDGGLKDVDVVVMSLPMGSGKREGALQLVTEMRSTVAPRKVPVIGLTGDHVRLNRSGQKMLDLDDAVIVAKPFSLDELLDLVATMVARARGDKAVAAASATAATALLYADDRGRYINANRAALELLGYSLEELLELTVADVVAASPTTTQEEWARYQDAGTWSAAAFELRRRDGTPLHARIHASVIRGDDGEAPLFVAWVRPEQASEAQ